MTPAELVHTQPVFMAKVYALFVGIDKYQPPVKALEGSVADIAAMEALFATRIPPASLELKTLRDDAATRAAIIDGFRSHLRQAGSNDVALFYYCGHGSQEPCPSEWLHIEPSWQEPTLIPVDARTGDVFDIADKELSALIPRGHIRRRAGRRHHRLVRVGRQYPRRR